MIKGILGSFFVGSSVAFLEHKIIGSPDYKRIEVLHEKLLRSKKDLERISVCEWWYKK
jgi:hypothetical protein